MIRNIWIWLLFPCILFSFIRLRLLSIRRHFKQALKIPFSLRQPLLKAIDNLSPIVLLIVIPIFAIVIYTFFEYTRESLKNHKYSLLLLLIYTIVLVSLSALFLLMIRALIRHLQAIYFNYTYAQMKKPSETKGKQQMSCVCTNFFVNDNDFYKNLSISSYTCQYCDIKLELPENGSLMNIDDLKLMLINKHKSIMLELSSQLESKLSEYAEKCAEFSLTQADHFENIRRDIDIARETLLQEIYDNNSVNSSKEEQIQKQSIDMIKQVECTEEAFRANFNREIQRKKNDLVSIVCDFDLNEQRNLENIQNHKLKIESRLEFVQKNINRFKLFEYDLVRNKFQHASKNDESNEANLGQVILFNTFLTEDSQHLITYAKECNEIQIWDVDTSTLIDKRYTKVTCFCLDEKTNIICGYNLGEIKIYDISSNRQVFFNYIFRYKQHE